MSKKTISYAFLFILILVVTVLPYLYDTYQQRLYDQNRLNEIKSKLVIIQNFGSQNDQMRTEDRKDMHINEDSSKSSIDDRPQKEEKDYVGQNGDNLSKISSTNKITIQELKVINKRSSREAIYTTNKITIQELIVINERGSGEAVHSN